MRFTNIENRSFATVIHQLSHSFFPHYVQAIKEAKWNRHKWKNLTLMKDPMTLSIYMMMLQDIRPRTILEFGTYDGGSALWMQDLIESIGYECDIHTFDINEEQVKLPKECRIKYHKLDNHKIKEFISQNLEFFQNIKGPVLVIEDSHENCAELVNCIDPFLSCGDYLIVEDTLDLRKYNETIASESCLKKLNYQVDTYYCDFWGTNNSWNINSILRKM